MRAVNLCRTGRGRAFGFAAALALASAVAAAAPAGFDRPSFRERLEPGSTVVASWSLDAETLRGLDEAELVLSLDGGVTFPVRLTARIGPEARSTTWRVPALPTENARVALRAGLDERASTEEFLFVSEPFAIASPGTRPREELFAVNDEWRTREALEGAPARAPSSTCQSPGPELELDPLDADDADDAGTDDALAADPGATLIHADRSAPPLTIRTPCVLPSTLREAAAPLRL